MTKLHCCIDIESLSQDPRAAVISIGACTFNETGIIDTFKVNIRPESAKAFGMIISKDTIDWWLKQAPEVRAAALERNVDADFGLTQFVNWYKERKPAYIWSQGTSFDIVIMEYAIRCVGLDVPWKYSSVMDMRTVFNMFGIYTKDLHKAAGDSTHHDALSDAMIQSKALIAMLNAMSWGKAESPLRI